MPTRYPQATFDEARRLRATGMSNAAIAERLGVSPAWVSVNCRDVELTEEQRKGLHAYRKVVHQIGSQARSATYRRRRATAQGHGRALARVAPADFIAGCMLYWAEGAKDRNVLKFTNADPAMVRYWIDWCEQWLDAARGDLAVRINCFLGNGLSLDEIERWWLAELDIPATALRRSIVNRPSRASKGVRRPLLRGTVSVELASTDAAQLVYGAIQEYAGFERPEWLDMGTITRSA